MKSLNYGSVLCWSALTLAGLINHTWAQEAAKSTAPAEASAKETPALNPKTVEEGFKMLEAELDADSPPTTMSPVERANYLGNKIKGILELIDKIWALNPDLQQKKELIEVKMQMTSLQGRMGDPTAKDRLVEYLTKLSKDDNAEIAAIGKDSLTMLKINSIFNLEPEERNKLISDVKAEVMTGEPTMEKLQVASALARAVGFLDENKPAAEISRSFAEFFSNSSNEDIKAVAESFAGAARRYDLPGNEMKVVGKTLSGQAYDLAQQKGKVVLVDFWATWCGPCIAEFPNMKQLYDVYHPHGFEIVGISLDQSRAQLEAFLKTREVPWTILHEDNPEGGNEIADYYGINAIPSMVLVGQDGKVVSINARGEALQEELAKLYPNVKAPAPPAEEDDEEAEEAEEEAQAKP